ncbi:MAG: ATP-binding cassette domain-containing protein [Parcubacteria group bacterium]|nr:ATP-binding cassette domain-containing protein [Parcubacteria group bacterium]
MKSNILQIKHLTVNLGRKRILHDLNLTIKQGEIRALLGPNGSGKTTLAQVLLGLSPYKVTQGNIIFKNKNITHFSPERRVHLGMGLVFQNPPAIKGVTLNKLIQEISAQQKGTKVVFTEKKLINLQNREINLDFSGGEKKLSELYQLSYLNPQFMILDEIDSGLDIESLQKIIYFLKHKFYTKQRAFLLITHRADILKYLNPSMAHILLDGKIICSAKDWLAIWKTIKKYGYEKCKICPKKIC